VELVIEHLWKTYPNGVVALSDVSLTMPRGLFGLLGPNGAGKSTLMRILATLQEADAGAARLGTVDVLGDRESVRRTLGYLPQEFGLYPKISAEAMLDHFALLKGIANPRERRDTVHALLQQTNLWNARKRKLGGFSGGMRQRFGIAVALIGSPRLIIVDEPTAGLDPAERARFLNLLSELGENAVVILSTHIVEDVSDLCTRMAIIEGGRILLEGEPAQAVRMMEGRVWRRQVERAELPGFERVLPLISTTLVGGRTVIHVVGDAPPDPSFEPVEPDLKDVYFTVIRGIPLAPPPRAPSADVAPIAAATAPPSPVDIAPSAADAPASPAPKIDHIWPVDAPASPAPLVDRVSPVDVPASPPPPAGSVSIGDASAEEPAAALPPSAEIVAPAAEAMTPPSPPVGPGAAHIPRFQWPDEMPAERGDREDASGGDAPPPSGGDAREGGA
jgi:ABC-2 type transport system ATP-binding protein